MSGAQRSRPAEANHEAAGSPAGDSPILSPDAEEWQRLALHVDGAFVVVVETTHGKYRRRVWLTLAAAERAAEKAREAGHNAVVVLAELKPLYRVHGAAPELGRIIEVPKGGAA